MSDKKLSIKSGKNGNKVVKFPAKVSKTGTTLVSNEDKQ